MSSPQPPAIDLDELLGRCLGNLELAESAVSAFLEEFPSNYQQLDAAASRFEPTTLAAVSHRMKGAARNIGATPLGDMLASLEQLVDEAGHNEIRTLVDNIALEARRLEEALS
ncbi:Hpt domain protein [Posidoniimonas polymericola]|uniref:Hpt domain protein n=1 Tax=Posidoniimonas polymericola TaxID=2528002 RepID=A0A5C5YQV5_9BACT|nr:Hpt domain-containing protein [Posidoniimonas polymericola]TWT77127.1 Hpt domain protein [Posidoniimonas polymericola]